MRRAVWVSVFCCLATAVAAQSDSAVARVAAGLVLADAARQAEDADLLLTGLEMVLTHRPMDETATRLLDTHQTEALFLIRGDEALTSRLDEVQSLAGADPADALWIVSGDSEFNVPEGQGISAFAAASGASAQSLLGSNAMSCVRNRSVWECDPNQIQGRISLGQTDWVVLATRPVAP